MLTQEEVVERLKTVRYPGYSRDIVSFGLVKEVTCEDGVVFVRVAVTTADKQIPTQIKESALAALEVLPGVQEARIQVDVTAPSQAPAAEGLPQTRIAGVKHVIAVASGKGGVGKSTVAANLAVALNQLPGPSGGNLRIGLCDCDIYGPSIPLMFGSSDKPEQLADGKIKPILRYGISLMSMGFLLEDSTPAILRGPMVTKFIQQFLRWVDWTACGGDLDYLILDLPPGTGDIQLTIVQTVSLSGAIIVTTPQEVALIDARKASSMFNKVNVPIIGLIENMSFFVCPNDGNRYHIFGEGGGRREAAAMDVPLLGQIPIEISLRESGDLGCPYVEKFKNSETAKEFLKIAEEVCVKSPISVVS